ncbi:MAG: hypothetical protein AABY75_04445, partial [Bacteroidota bacterium]
SVREGKGIATILTNEKGRVIDVVGAVTGPDGRLLLACAGDRDGRVGRWLERFIIMEDVVVRDVTDRYLQVICYAVDEISHRWSPPLVAGSLRMVPFSIWKNHWSFVVIEARIWKDVESVLREEGGASVDRTAFDRDRIAAGVPWAGTEISDQRNPLESRLRSLISFTKGCYVGQEVIARLDTYRKVRAGLTRFSGSLPEGAIAPLPIHTSDGTEAGILSSVGGDTKSQAIALGFVRTHLLKPDLVLNCSGRGELRPLDTDLDEEVYRSA